MPACNVCLTPFGEPLYVSPGENSVTSLCEVIPGKTTVYYCERCGHLNTLEMVATDSYYDESYRILLDSEDEDQLYQIAGERKVYRSEHQADTLLAKVELRPHARILDYGCAKGATLRRIAAHRPDVVPHLFDVSEMYVPFWEKFAAPHQWAIYAPNPAWEGSFDLVASFYALEHVADPRAFVRSVAALLAEGGACYVLVPNVYANLSDFVVADHINHFSDASLRYLFHEAGLRVDEIDTTSHACGFIVVARKRADCPPPAALSAPSAEQVNLMADYWQCYGHRIRAFEQAHPSAREVAIYGSGFYGTSVATHLAHPERIACFLDQNPYRQGKTLLGRPIVAPDQLSAHIDTIYVGLNPRTAREAIESVAGWHGRRHEYCYP